MDPDVLGEIVQEVVRKDLPHDQMLDAVTESIDKRYPKLEILKKRSWSWSNAGGAMLQISFIYGSLTEYLMFAHTPTGTEGHSGIYQSKLWDWVLEGEMWRYNLGDSERTVYRKGDVGLLQRGGHGEAFCVKDNLTVLEYCRGLIPLMMPFGLADSVFSTLDFKSVRHQSWIYTKLCTKQLLKGRI
jgi:C-8 sterol isomerase